MVVWAPAAVTSGDRSSFRVVRVVVVVVEVWFWRRVLILGLERRLVVRILLRWARVETSLVFCQLGLVQVGI